MYSVSPISLLICCGRTLTLMPSHDGPDAVWTLGCSNCDMYDDNHDEAMFIIENLIAIGEN